MQADIKIGLRTARVGFAGPNVILNTMYNQKQDAYDRACPSKFQSSPYLFDHGQLDIVVEKEEDAVAVALKLLRLIMNRNAGFSYENENECPKVPILGEEEQLTNPHEIPNRDFARGRLLDRVQAQDVCESVLQDYVELCGDGRIGKDTCIHGGIARLPLVTENGEAVVSAEGGGLGQTVVVVGTFKAHTEGDFARLGYGMATPHGYRTALRLFQLAERLNLPVITLIDTVGAMPSFNAERDGQSEAIATNLTCMAGLRVPVLACVLGEGGSGGALGLGVGNSVAMCSSAWYGCISPEGAASILGRYKGEAHKAHQFPLDCQALATVQQIYADQLYRRGVVDAILWEEEDLGRARETYGAFPQLRRRLLAWAWSRLLDVYTRVARGLPSAVAAPTSACAGGPVLDADEADAGLSPALGDAVVRHRYRKFRAIGPYACLTSATLQTWRTELAERTGGGAGSGAGTSFSPSSSSSPTAAPVAVPAGVADLSKSPMSPFLSTAASTAASTSVVPIIAPAAEPAGGLPLPPSPSPLLTTAFDAAAPVLGPLPSPGLAPMPSLSLLDHILPTFAPTPTPTLVKIPSSIPLSATATASSSLPSANGDKLVPVPGPTAPPLFVKYLADRVLKAPDAQFRRQKKADFQKLPLLPSPVSAAHLVAYASQHPAEPIPSTDPKCPYAAGARSTTSSGLTYPPYAVNCKYVLDTTGDPQAVVDYVRAHTHERCLITDTTMRDAHQSLLATRVRTVDMYGSVDASVARRLLKEMTSPAPSSVSSSSADSPVFTSASASSSSSSSTSSFSALSSSSFFSSSSPSSAGGGGGAAAEASRVFDRAFSLEMWGGATFDVALRFLREDPWERVRLLRRKIPNVLFQMLIRGSNIVGYTNYPDNAVEQFVAVAAEAGIDVFRIFDCFNDLQKMAPALKAVLRARKIAELCICYTSDFLDPAETLYTLDYYGDLAKKIEEMGAHFLGIKDMAGLLKPQNAEPFIKRLRESCKLPIHFHTHNTSGNALATCLEMQKYGCDIIDLAVSGFSDNTSQPSLNAFLAATENTPRPAGIPFRAVEALSSYYTVVRTYYTSLECGMKSSTARVYDHEIPGGQYSNLLMQSKSLDIWERWDEVLDMYRDVNALLGNIVKVTPSSKCVGDLALYLLKNDLTTADVRAGTKNITYPESVEQLFRGELGYPHHWRALFASDADFLALRTRVIKGGEENVRGVQSKLPQVDFAELKSTVRSKLRLVRGNPYITYAHNFIRHDAADDPAVEPSYEDIISSIMHPTVYEDYVKHVATYGSLTLYLPTPVHLHGMDVGDVAALRVPLWRVDADLRAALDLPLPWRSAAPGQTDAEAAQARALAGEEEEEVTIVFQLVRVSAIDADSKRTLVFRFNGRHDFKVRVEDKEGGEDAAVGVRADPKDRTQIPAPVPAIVTQLAVKVGDVVAEGAEIVKLTAMKMVVKLRAPFAGVVKSVDVKEGDKINAGTLLMKIAPN